MPDQNAPRAPGIDPRAAMLIALVVSPEARRLVSLWPTLRPKDRQLIVKGDPDASAYWLATAGIANIVQHRLEAQSLVASGVCRPDGSVVDEVQRAIAAASIRAMRARTR